VRDSDAAAEYRHRVRQPRVRGAAKPGAKEIYNLDRDKARDTSHPPVAADPLDSAGIASGERAVAGASPSAAANMTVDRLPRRRRPIEAPFPRLPLKQRRPSTKRSSAP